MTLAITPNEIFNKFMALYSYEQDKLVAEAIDLPGADDIAYLSQYFSPTYRKEDWDAIADFIRKFRIELDVHVFKGEALVRAGFRKNDRSRHFLNFPSPPLARLKLAAPKEGKWVEKILNLLGSSERWDLVLAAHNERELLKAKTAALLTAVELLKEKAAGEAIVQGELVSVKPAEYFLEAVYRLPGDIYRTIMCEKREGAEAMEHETVLPKFREVNYYESDPLGTRFAASCFVEYARNGGAH